jgi:hypothetical protein
VTELSADTIKFREKKSGQRACDVKDEKGKLCVGHLKLWANPTEEAIQAAGKGVDLYRCERCKALYLPAPNDDSSAGLRYEKRPVNVLGNFSR